MTREDASKLVDDLIQTVIDYENADRSAAKYLRQEYLDLQQKVIDALSPSEIAKNNEQERQ
jgi:hypothetical protein